VCIDNPETTVLLAAYRETWDVDRLDDIARRQAALYAHGASLHPAVAVFASRTRQDGMPWRDTQTGEPVRLGRRFSRNGMMVRVADLEAFLRTKKSTKLSDLTPFLLSGGRTLATHDATAPGQFVFPDGEDHASTYTHQPVSLL